MKIVALILWIFLLALLPVENRAWADNQEVTLRFLPLPPPLTDYSWLSGIQTQTNEDAESEYYQTQVDEWKQSHLSLLEESRNRFRHTVYIRADIVCNLQTQELIELVEANENILTDTQEAVLSLVAELLHVPVRKLIPSNYHLVKDPHEKMGCDAQLKAWGTPMAVRRGI